MGFGVAPKRFDTIDMAAPLGGLIGIVVELLIGAASALAIQQPACGAGRKCDGLCSC